jgi:mannose-1-phosphate guanylyltransferase
VSLPRPVGKMKAAILAGGLGTRLRPITHLVPKPLIPLVGKPMIMHIIDSLPDYVDTVLLAVNYKREDLESYFSKAGIDREVILIEEDAPLGTGGALRNLMEHLDSTFLAFNGDIVSSLDVRDLVHRHREFGGIGSLALWEVPDPSAYGVVGLDGERVTSFQEKPLPGEEVSNLINAGAYVFEPEIFDHIPEGKVSIEREVFPKILDKGLRGHRFKGHWVDCGTRESFLKAQGILMEKAKMECHFNRFEDTTVIGNNHLEHCTARRASIGPMVSAMDAAFDEGSQVINSLVMEGSIVGKDAKVINSMLGPGSNVKNDEMVIDAIIGEGNSHR